MAFLKDKCRRFPLSREIIGSCAPFSCGDRDLDEFFNSDYADYQRQLMGKTYVYNKPEACEYYQRNGFNYMFGSEDQEKQYRNIETDAALQTRLMFFDLMQIVEPLKDAHAQEAAQ